MNNDIVFAKLGGSIIRNQRDLNSTISQLEELVYIKKLINKVVFIPGGGDYANFIRKIDQKLNIGKDLAHWAAILSMDSNALEIHTQFQKIQLISDFSELQAILFDHSVSKAMIIFQCFKYLKKQDELPHSWDVTSDSIAIYMASKLNLDRCILIKNVDGIIDRDLNLIKELTTEEFRTRRKNNLLARFQEGHTHKRSKPIDEYSLKLIESTNIQCILVNGTQNKNRIIEYFSNPSEKNKIYTKITK